MLNIVVPMAGRGSRFANAGYKTPKPLIEVYGHPMIEYVTKNITPACEHRFVFICQEEHLAQYALAETLERIAPGCAVVTVDHITEGAACTVLLAEKYIDNEDGMMLANSDQYVDAPIGPYLAAMGDLDGLIMTMPSQNPACSYIQYDENGLVTMVREKEVISREATVGIYNYRHGADFVKYAKRMIERNLRVNGEFYVAPVYNLMIEDGKRIGFHNVGDTMYGLGTPADLNDFMSREVSRRVFA